jgi:putative FmdB family regulatory protein
VVDTLGFDPVDYDQTRRDLMPMYDCYCKACGHEDERLLKRDELAGNCLCGEPMFRKDVQLSSFALKGGGWYKDGYASTGSVPANKESR